MTGREEVWRLTQRLDTTFSRAEKFASDIELQSDLARYLCVLVSGFFEKSISELLLEHARQNSAPSVQRFVENRTRRITNVNCQRLQEILGSFDPDWRADLEGFLVDEKKDAVDSVVSLRNTIAHGQSVGITFHRITNYYGQIKKVVNHVADLCEPR